MLIGHDDWDGGGVGTFVGTPEGGNTGNFVGGDGRGKKKEGGDLVLTYLKKVPLKNKCLTGQSHRCTV